METIRKIFEAIGKVTTMLMAVVIGIYMARFLPLWLNNWREYVNQDRDGMILFGHWESDFRKSMEE